MVDLTGQTTMMELLHLFNLSQVLITNDSGPAHFACLTGIHVVVFFGPELPDRYRPLARSYDVVYTGFTCSPCVSPYNQRLTPCNDNLCLKTIDVREVGSAGRGAAYNRKTVSHQEHKARGPVSVGCFVLTVSDTRTSDTRLERPRHPRVPRARRPPGDRVRHRARRAARWSRASVKQWLTDADTRVIITTGGTGITARDGTFEAMDALFEKRLDGFGELFRMLSFDEIGVGGDDEPRHGRHGGRARRSSCCPGPSTPSGWRCRG